MARFRCGPILFGKQQRGYAARSLNSRRVGSQLAIICQQNPKNGGLPGLAEKGRITPVDQTVQNQNRERREVPRGKLRLSETRFPNAIRIAIMKNLKVRSVVMLLALAVLAGAGRVAAQGTAFTYQGQLDSGANAVTGLYDFEFGLYNAASGGAQAGSTLNELAVGVTNGLFTVTLDFGAVFNGAAYWLAIGVRSNGDGAFIPLVPRQELTPAPYSITAQNVTGAVPLAQLPATVALINDAGTANFFAGQYAGNSSVSGSANTAVGYEAMSSAGSGSLNTAQGFSALEFNQTGTNNSAFGAAALQFNFNGNNNTGTGTYALSAAFVGPDLTGSGNTADGGYALADDETGYNNTAAGFESLYANTTGFDNVGMGVATFQANSSAGRTRASGLMPFSS